MRSCWRSKVALTPIGTFRGAEAGTRTGGGFASGVVGQSLSRGYGSCRTLVRSSRERAAERREALPEKGRPAGRRAGLTFNNTTRRVRRSQQDGVGMNLHYPYRPPTFSLTSFRLRKILLVRGCAA